MITVEETLQEPSPSQVTAALIDLAKLAQRAGTVSGAVHTDLAREMVERVVGACHARQGALLLASPGDLFLARPLSPSEQTLGLRLLALHETREEDIVSQLADFVPVTPEREQVMLAHTGWIMLSQPVAGDQGAHSLYILLGWTGAEQETSAASMLWGQHVLPLLADAIASVVVAMLQAERLQELERAATEASLATMDLFKAELLATVSHELRSPLASIKGYAATLLRHERRLPREERRQFLLAIDEGTTRLESIIDRLLEVSRLETEAISLNRVPVDAVRLAREALTVARSGLSAERANRFTFHLLVEDSKGHPASRVPAVAADLQRLREVLDNLLDNAINYSPEGGDITLIVRPVYDAASQRLAGGRQARSRSMLEIAVCDTGMGMAPEHLERIFERFYRVDRRLTREVNGLGLGLAICKRIVELHGGAIWAESLPGDGSIIRVWLPLETASAA